jgi:hypothetical protein
MTHLPQTPMQFTLEHIRTQKVRTKQLRTQALLGVSFLLVGIGGTFGGFFAATLSSSPSPSEIVLFGEVDDTPFYKGGSDPVLATGEQGDFDQQQSS